MSTSAAFPPSPFDPPDPASVGRTRSWLPWLIGGVGALMLLVLVAGGLLVAKQNELLTWTMTTLEERLAPRLGPELSPAARDRLTASFATAKEAIMAKRFDLFALERAQSKLLSAASGPPGEPLSEEQVLALAEALEKIAVPAAPVEPPDPVAPAAEEPSR